MSVAELAGHPPAARVTVAISPDTRASRIFIHLAFFTCLCLQRFGYLFGDSGLFLSLPVFALMIGWAFVTGFGELRTTPLLLFGLFAAGALSSTLLGLLNPDARFGISVPSLILILASYTLITVGPSRRFDRSQVLPIFLFYARLAAILGIAQYLAQFIGIRIFSFMETVPALKPVLIERLFNYNPIVGYESPILRANGFFLVEPSTFSQLLCLAFAIEFFLFRRMLWLPVYGIAYIFSNSGTGLLVLAIALPLYALFGWRRLGQFGMFVVAGAVLGLAGSLFLPDQFGTLSGRVNEIGSTGSSAYARYLAQFDLIGTYGGELRGLIGWGPGAMERADGFVPGSSNPSLKLFFDYGLMGLILFWTFLIKATWQPAMPLISIILLVQFQLGGGSLLFSPLLVLIAMLCIWSGPARTSPAQA